MLDIRSLIPHRPPMLLVDEVLRFDAGEKELLAQKKVRGDEYFLHGHYPDQPIVPGVITCECLFQTGAALIAALGKEGLIDASSGLPVVARIGQAKFKNMILPGDTIELKVRLTNEVSGAFYLKGSASVEGKVRATVDFTCMMVK